MAGSGAARAVFCYVYQPDPAVGDGGFSFSLFDNEIGVFTCYDVNGQPVDEKGFRLPQNTARQLQLLAYQNRSWLQDVPTYMRVRDTYQYASVIGLDGYPLIRLEDFCEMMNCPFRSARGHYARMLYNLLEDASNVLWQCGLDLQPFGFTWDTSRIEPMPPVVPQQQMYG